MNSHSPQFFMSEALRLAEKALFTTSPNPRVGCVIVQNNEIVGRGYHVKAGESHAEVIALKEAGSKSEGGDVYVTLEPCQMCAGALYWSQISKIVFGASDENRGFEKMGTQLHPKTTVVSGVLAEDASELMKRFFAERRK